MRELTIDLESVQHAKGGYSTLIDVVRAHAHRRPSEVAYILLGDGEHETGRLTFGELDTWARAIAVKLREAGVRPGARALLLYPSALDFITGFFGAIFAGLVPVPVIPPRNERSGARCLSVAQDCAASLVMTTAAQLPSYRAWLGRDDELDALWFESDAATDEQAERWSPPPTTEDSASFLQYTSGSTGSPKGVVVTHKNILANQRAIEAAFGHGPESVVVGWLPLFHDMGLIGNVMQPLYLGVLAVLLPPLAFLQKPSRWLDAIGRYRATTSGGPSFAYELCAATIRDEQLAQLDLSSWSLAFNGAEPVRADTIERFSARFAPYGFRRSAFYPCYGLAENTLFATGGPRGEVRTLAVDATRLEQHQLEVVASDAPRAKTIVGCGQTWDDQQVAIVEPSTKTRSHGAQVGEIWLAGPSVTDGYFRHETDTERVFHARLAGSRERWLRTGDLGFVRDGSLYVTGRLKDLIIVRGRNYYPQDIELSVERCHPVLASGGGAAFTATVGDEEGLVIVQEIDFAKRHAFDTAAIGRAIRKAVAEEHELAVSAICLLKPRSIPKTSSGKVRRRACRELFMRGQLPSVQSPSSHGVVAS